MLVFADGKFALAAPIDPDRLQFELDLPDRDTTQVRFIVTSADGTAAELEYSPARVPSAIYRDDTEAVPSGAERIDAQNSDF